MVQYGKVSSMQIVLTLVVCKLFAVITYTPVYTEKAEITAVFLGGVVSTLILLAAATPVILLFRKTQDDILTLSYRLNPGFGFIVFILLLIGVLAAAVDTMVDFQFFMVNAVFPDASRFIILITLMIAAFYASLMGLEGIARTGTILFLIVLIALVTIAFTLHNRINLLNLKPVLYEPVKSILSVAWQDTARNMELLIFMMVVPNIKGKAAKSLLGYILLISVLLCTISFLVATVLGEFTFRQIFPFYMIASVVDSKIIRRFDAIHMTLWVITAFLRTSLFLLTATSLLKRVLPYHIGKWSCLFSSVVILVAAGFLSGDLQSSNLLYDFIGKGYPFVILIVLLPIILLLNLKRISPSASKNREQQRKEEKPE